VWNYLLLSHSLTLMGTWRHGYGTAVLICSLKYNYMDPCGAGWDGCNPPLDRRRQALPHFTVPGNLISLFVTYTPQSPNTVWLLTSIWKRWRIRHGEMS
jgi:hypothetical protein